jgi:DNA polymerase
MAPPPPQFHDRKRLVTPRVSTSTAKDIGYKLPMAGPHMPAWKDVLIRCGYPTACNVIDFESYFDEEYHMPRGSGEGLSTVEYILDPRFEVLGCAFTHVHDHVSFPDYEGGATTFTVQEDATLARLRWLQQQYGQRLENCTVIMQNAKYDASVLAYRYGIYPRFIVDVLGLARAWNARTKHGLGEMVAKFGLPAKGDTEEFRGLTFKRRFVKPTKKRGSKLPVQRPIITDEQIGKLSAYACNDGMREWELFTILLPLLSRPEVELPIMQHTLELQTRPSIMVDFPKGEDIARRMDAEIERVIAPTGLTRAEVSKDGTFEEALTLVLQDAGDDPEQYKKQTARPIAAAMGGGFKRSFAIAKADPEREVLCKHPDERVRHLMAARGAIDSWPNHISRVNRIMRMARACDGVLPVPLKYHGAHTGRWSGDEKINLQNLGSRGHELVNAVREMLIARSGRSLRIADLAAIEARVLAWIAGQWDLVTKFANGEEIYCGFAEDVLGYPVRKPRKSGGIPSIEAKMKWARNSIGKVGILGCGYGMGAAKTEGYAQGEIDFETAEKIVKTYRAKNTEIVKFWSDIERAFVYTVKYGKPCEMPRGLRFDQSDTYDAIITLPSGRELHYHKVRLTPDRRGDTIEVWNGREHHWEHLWGGTLTENVVQAMSRDLIAEALLRLETQGIHVVHHCHDELVAEGPAETGEADLKAMIHELTTRPAWGPELPLAAEGKVSVCYGDH